MSSSIRRVDYFNTSVKDEPGEAYGLLARLAEQGVNLLAFTGYPIGPTRTQLSLFPEDVGRMEYVARAAGLTLDGPYPALLVQGTDELGVLARIHARLQECDVNVFASTGVAGGQGTFGYLLYVRPEEFDKASAALEL